MRYARKYSSSSEQAEDLVFEAFARILATIKRGKGPTISMGHYLVSTIRNVAVTGVAHESQEFARDPLEVAQMYENEQFSDHVKTSEWLTDAFNTLSDRSQLVVWFRVIDNMASKEIASTLGVSAATITREYHSAVEQLREEFVNYAVAGARDPVCKTYAPLLRRFAKNSSTKRALDTDEAFRAHAASCSHCSAVVSRLKAEEKALLSIIFMAGLGSLASQSLASAPPAAAGSLFASLGLPAKVALLAVPVVGVGVVLAGTFVLAAPDPEPATVTLGDVGAGGTSTLFQVGDCAVERQALDARSEVWRLSSDDEACDVKITFAAAGDAGADEGEAGVAETALDTNATDHLRTIEVTQAGTYTLVLSDGASTQTETVEVAGK
jgi:RNA polymerase sigma factor (sigma-70 family)